MRRALTFLATTAMVLGLGLVGSATASAATAPTVSRVWIATDTNRVGILDAGDVLRVKFTKPIAIADITSMGVDVRGDNGVGMRLENEAAPYGMHASVKKRVLIMRINLIPEEYGVVPLTYPLRLTDTTSSDGKVFYNVSGTDGVPVEVGTRDTLIGCKASRCAPTPPPPPADTPLPPLADTPPPPPADTPPPPPADTPPPPPADTQGPIISVAYAPDVNKDGLFGYFRWDYSLPEAERAHLHFSESLAAYTVTKPLTITVVDANGVEHTYPAAIIGSEDKVVSLLHFAATEPGVPLPLTITSVNGLTDLAGNPVDLARSDVTIEGVHY